MNKEIKISKIADKQGKTYYHFEAAEIVYDCQKITGAELEFLIRLIKLQQDTLKNKEVYDLRDLTSHVDEFYSDKEVLFEVFFLGRSIFHKAYPKNTDTTQLFNYWLEEPCTKKEVENEE